MCMPVPRPALPFQFFKTPIQVFFDAERISSDGGLLLVRQIDDRLGISFWFAQCLPDSRAPQLTVHSRHEQVRQRLYQIIQGYPDCNDANDLRNDPLFKMACDRDPDDKQGLSSQSTLCRLENVATPQVIRKLIRRLEDHYVESLPETTNIIVLDIDTTEDPAHGQQEFVGFNAHYDTNMYLHLLLFDGEGELISALLRPGRAGAAKGVAGLLARIVRKLKTRFPQAQILVRGDGAFATPAILNTLEGLNQELGEVDYLLGLPKNSRLVTLLQPTLDEAKEQYQQTKKPVQLFTDFFYKTKDSWPHERRVIGKAEHTALGLNPRFLVTSLEGFSPELLYKRGYCGRGEAENSIKDLKNALCSDRLSCHGYWVNFLRLLFFAAAYRLMYGLRAELAALLQQRQQQGEPVGPDLGRSQFDTLRLKLLKVGAQVKRLSRRIVVRMSAAFPLAELFGELSRRLQAPPKWVVAPG
jgi:Transposase DDE domain group 1